MKNFVIFIGILVVVVVAAIKVPIRDGKPLIESAPAQKLLGKSRDLVEPAVRLAEKVEKKVTPEAQVYRWRDTNGTWHFSEKPPAGVRAEPVEMPELNTLTSEQVINSGI